MRRLIKGAWKARAWVVLLGTSVALFGVEGFGDAIQVQALSPGSPGGGV